MMDKFLEVAKLICPPTKENQLGFIVPPDQSKYYINLIKYFAKDQSCEWDLDKGILVNGSVGCGKTLSFKIMCEMFHGFQVVVCRYLIREFLQRGTEVIDIYGRKSFKIKSSYGDVHIDYETPLTKCFDDLGLEEVNQKLYGNQQNVMMEIMLDRYDMFTRYKMITFATTNLTPDELEQQYGFRMRDRMREMMNYVTMEGNSFRK